MKIRIRWKLASIYTAITIAILLFFYIYLNSTLTSYAERNLSSNLTKQLLSTKDLLEGRPAADSEQKSIQNAVKRMGSILGLRVTIISPDGALIGDSDLDYKGLRAAENHMNRPEIQQALKSGIGQSRGFSTTVRKEMLYIAAPLRGTYMKGFLRFAMPLSDLEAFKTRIWSTTGNTLFVSLIAVLAISIIFGSLMTHRINEIVKIANNISRLDFSKKVLYNSKDELGNLAQAINNMSGELQKNIAKLASEEARLEAMLSSMAEGVLVTNNKGYVIMINPSLRRMFLVGNSPEGKKPLEAIRNNQIQEIVDTVISGPNRTTSREIYVLLPEEMFIRVNGVPIINNGILEGALLVFHDISELRRLENIRKDFVANVSHELRTPISSIKGYAETLLDGAIEDRASARDFIKTIYADSERLAKLIEDILDLSKIESGAMRLTLSSVPISDIVNRAFAIMDNQAKQKGISLNKNIPQNMQNIIADEQKIAQVMINLLDNAIKYTPENGSVTVSVHKKEGHIQVDVADTGIGISREDIPRIFERFYRVDKARSRDLGGTGLGLSIVKHIVQNHEGRIWVISEPDKGSTFSFTIPVAC